MIEVLNRIKLTIKHKLEKAFEDKLQRSKVDIEYKGK
jgi:hypothetical protein